MEIDLRGRQAGVAAIFYIPEQIERFCTTVQELRTKRSTNKVAFQRTIPMESFLPGESERKTLRRLAKEEVHLDNFSVSHAIESSRRIAVCELNVGVFVPVYNVPIPPDANVILGSESEEVANLGWTPMEEILDEPSDSLYFRPGNFEAILSHVSFLADPENYSPRLYRFYQLKHKIPIKLFDLVESGLNVEEALFQLGRVWRPPVLDNLSLVRSSRVFSYA